jgi:magnesium transporter
MFEDEDDRIEEVMTKDFAYISPIADKESAIPICKEYDIPVLPVVSSKGEMLGIVTFDDVMDVLEEANTEDILKQAAVVSTDTPYMESKIYKISLSYVIWLVILLVINTFTGIIISRFEAALLTLPILLSFIPALNDSVGNSSSQTTSMVIRALTTGEITKKDYFKVFGKELLTGFITGLIVALFNFGWVMLELNTPILNTESIANNSEMIAKFGGSLQAIYLSIASIASISLLFGIMFSKFLASILPIVAKAIHIDPAVMSGPLMTSLMDIVTLLLYFSIATALIDFIAPGTLVI